MPYVTSIEQMAIEKERQTIARNLLRQNIAVDMIVQVTGLTVEQVQELQASQQDN